MWDAPRSPHCMSNPLGLEHSLVNSKWNLASHLFSSSPRQGWTQYYANLLIVSIILTQNNLQGQYQDYSQGVGEEGALYQTPEMKKSKVEHTCMRKHPSTHKITKKISPPPPLRFTLGLPEVKLLKNYITSLTA